MAAIENPVTWVRCREDMCGGNDCGACGGQIFLAVDTVHWHVGSVTGTAYHRACGERLGAK